MSKRWVARAQDSIRPKIDVDFPFKSGGRLFYSLVEVNGQKLAEIIRHDGPIVFPAE
jgi:hypothetical protein